MDFAPILIYVCLGLIGIGALLIMGFGVMNLTRGKSRPITLGIIAVPLIVFFSLQRYLVRGLLAGSVK